MQGFDDYYRILQVHYLAETEVIVSAYKKLAQKYHPDINKALDAETRMKKINEAYDVLKDAEKRKKYDSDWVKKQDHVSNGRRNPREEIDEESTIPAKIILTRYFEFLKNKNFERAFQIISATDKSNVSIGDFLRWQNSVSNIYRLQSFTCTACKIDNNMMLNGSTYKQVIEFVVKTVEHNTIMGRLDKDIINKKVVLEKDGWHVLMGYEDITPYISEFEELNRLLLAKNVINEIVERNNNIDNFTGLLNKNGIIEEAEKEMWRHDRYGNAFSLMLLEIDCSKDKFRKNGQELKNYSVEWASKILKNSFRKIDLIGRWGETQFFILMPETDLTGSFKAALKIKKTFETKIMIYDSDFFKITVRIGLDEVKGSLEYTIGKLSQYINIANKRKGNQIVHSYGIYE